MRLPVLTKSLIVIWFVADANYFFINPSLTSIPFEAAIAIASLFLISVVLLV